MNGNNLRGYFLHQKETPSTAGLFLFGTSIHFGMLLVSECRKIDPELLLGLSDEDVSHVVNFLYDFSELMFESYGMEKKCFQKSRLGSVKS